MNRYRIKTGNLAKKFRRVPLFRDISLDLESGMSLALTGANGSGKSTLLQILAGLQAPSRGSVSWFEEEEELTLQGFHRLLGFASPLVNLYGECTGFENIDFALNGTGRQRAEELLEYFALEGHERKPVKTWSSGMQQRLKLICAMAKESPFLFLDEPGTNLDRDGKKLLYDMIDSFKKERLVIIATNEPEEVKLCSREFHLG